MRLVLHLLLTAWLIAAPVALVAAPLESVPLRVAVYDVPPYGYVAPDGEIVGASVDLWRRVAQELERRFDVTPVRDMEGVLGGLEAGRFDVAIGAITITPDREQRVDFSYPAHRSGVAIALRRDSGPLAALTAYGSALAELGALLIVILVGLVTTGIAMWIIERRGRAVEHGSSHVATLRDGLYWAVVTMTTVGYGDKTPKTTPGRLVATLWMFGSLVLVSLLSTSLVSRLTAERVAQGDATASVDLGGRALGAVAGSSGAEYLDGLQRHYTTYKDVPAALDALASGRIGGVVNSVGALRWLVAKRYATTLDVADGLLAPAYMAFALPKGSQLRRPLDRALIKITSSPEWVAMESRFFAR